jgi:hypothetical protein
MNELGIGSPVHEANLYNFLEMGDVSDESLQKAGAAVDDIKGKMDALGFGTEGAE